MVGGPNSTGKTISLSAYVAETRQKRLAAYDSRRVRRAIYLALAQTSATSFIPVLCDLVTNSPSEHGHVSEYSHAIEALHLYGPAGATALLEAASANLSSGKPVPYYALIRLRRFLEEFEIPKSPDVETLVDGCLHSRSKRCRMAGMSIVRHYSLLRFGPAVEDLLMSARATDERFAGLGTLAHLGLPSSAPVFTRLLRTQRARRTLGDEHLTIASFHSRWFALTQTKEIVLAFLYFAKRGDVSVIDKIVSFVEDSLPNGEELVFISRALAEFAKTDVGFISRCLDSKDELLRGAAAWALGYAGTPATLERCRLMLAGEDSAYVAHCAASALGRAVATEHSGAMLALLEPGSRWAATS